MLLVWPQLISFHRINGTIDHRQYTNALIHSLSVFTDVLLVYLFYILLTPIASRETVSSSAETTGIYVHEMVAIWVCSCSHSRDVW